MIWIEKILTQTLIQIKEKKSKQKQNNMYFISIEFSLKEKESAIDFIHSIVE